MTNLKANSPTQTSGTQVSEDSSVTRKQHQHASNMDVPINIDVDWHSETDSAPTTMSVNTGNSEAKMTTTGLVSPVNHHELQVGNGIATKISPTQQNHGQLGSDPFRLPPGGLPTLTLTEIHKIRTQSGTLIPNGNTANLSVGASMQNATAALSAISLAELQLQRATSMAGKEAKKMQEFKGFEALVVDDAPINAKIAARLLQRQGFSVMIANGGKEALEIVNQHKASLQLVLLDLVMPEFDGHQTMTVLRKEQQHLPVIAVSGSCMDQDRMQCRSEGFAGFVSKPIVEAALLITIRKVLRVFSDAQKNGRVPAEKEFVDGTHEGPLTFSSEMYA
jgi:CheY-like chemotaxis protein